MYNIIKHSINKSTSNKLKLIMNFATCQPSILNRNMGEHQW